MRPRVGALSTDDSHDHSWGRNREFCVTLLVGTVYQVFRSVKGAGCMLCRLLYQLGLILTSSKRCKGNELISRNGR